jgi:hypothetical protein
LTQESDRFDKLLEAMAKGEAPKAHKSRTVPDRGQTKAQNEKGEPKLP